MIFGAKNEPKVKDNCCGSHENSIGWVCNHFIVVASAPYDAAAMIGTFLKHPLLHRERLLSFVVVLFGNEEIQDMLESQLETEGCVLKMLTL